jgi:hypothetical protein
LIVLEVVPAAVRVVIEYRSVLKATVWSKPKARALSRARVRSEATKAAARSSLERRTLEKYRGAAMAVVSPMIDRAISNSTVL